MIAEKLLIELEAKTAKYNSDIANAGKVTQDNVVKMQTGFNKLGDTTSKYSGISALAFDKLKTGMKDLANKSFDLTDAFVVLGGATALGFIAKKSLDAADAFADLSDNTGISTDLLQELGFAAQMTGVKQEELNGALLRFNRRIAEASSGTGEVAQGFASLGVAVQDNNGKMRSAEDIIFEVADGVQQLGSDTERSNALFKIFGNSGANLVNMFKNGSSELRNFQLQARELGLVLDRDLINSAAKANDQLDILSSVLKNQVTRAVIEIAPQIQQMTLFLTDLARAIMLSFKKPEQIEQLYDAIEETKFRIREVEGEISRSGGGLLGRWLGKAGSDELGGLKSKLADLTKEYDALLQKRFEDNRVSEQSTKSSEIFIGSKMKELETEQMVADAKLALAMQENTTLEEQTAAKMELLDAKFALEEEKTAEAYAQKLLTEEQYLTQLNALTQKKSAEKLSIEAAANKQQQAMDMALMSARVNTAQAAANLIVAISSKENKVAFYISKAAAIAQAIVSSNVAAANAMASIPYPANMAAASHAKIAGMLNVAAIVATSIKGFAKGGEIPGIGNTDSQLIRAMPGETMVDRSTTNMLREYLEAQQSAGSRNARGGIGGRIIISVEPREAAKWIRAQFIEQDFSTLSAQG